MTTTIVYHVTSVRKSEPRPQWKYLQPAPLRDETYDGPLVGLHAVSCSVTRINGELPRWTPYPTAVAAPASLWRALCTVRLGDFRVFRVHEHRTGRSGPRQVQLLLCKNSDRLEADFATALEMLDFDELFAPDYDGHFAEDGEALDYRGSEWVNLLFLSFLAVDVWDTATKRDSFGSGRLLERDPEDTVPDKQEMLAAWLAATARARGVDPTDFPVRFGLCFTEPSRSNFEKHRRAAAFLAHLPELYRKALKVLKDVDIDLREASESEITRALRKHKMPRICITCLNQMSVNKLVDHLVDTTLGDNSHIYSLDHLKEERDLVREKIKTGSEEDHMAKVVCAVKVATLIQLPLWAWAALQTGVREGRRRAKKSGKGSGK